MEIAQSELLIHEKGEQVDTWSQIKQCPMDGGLSYGTSDGWTIGIFVIYRNGPRQQFVDVCSEEDLFRDIGFFS